MAGLTFSSTYGYDASDHLTDLTYPSGRVVHYDVDPGNRLTQVKQNNAIFADLFTYNDNGQLGSYTTGAVTHTFTPDTVDRPLHIVSSGPGGALDLTYGYDGVSNVRTITDARPGASQSFTPDNLDRLQTANGPWGSLTWTYDEAGNRRTQTGAGRITYTYAPTQRLMSFSGAATESFGYDNAGRLTSDSRGIYTYTPTGRLATVTATGVSASYAYDAAGVRISHTVNGSTIYAIRSAAGDLLSEYEAPCSTPLWSRDVIYAAGRVIGAVRSTAATASVAATSASVSVSEGAGTVSVSFTLTTAGGAPLPCPVTAAYHTTDGSAAGDADFATRSGTVTFAAGSTNGSTQSALIPILQDTLDESDETFAVDLTTVTGGVLGASARTTVTILDDDAMPAVSIGSLTVPEGNSGTSPALFPVTLSTASGREVQVAYATSNGTATAGQDYLATSGTLTIPAGSTSATIAVAIIGDLIPEPTETFTVTLSAPVNATLGTATGVGTIQDGDSLTITLSADRGFPSAAGTPVTWTTTVSGGVAPYRYQYWLYDATAGWRIVQDYSTTATFVWTPALTGSYQLEVRVLDDGSSQAYDGAEISGTFTITAAPALATPVLTASAPFPAPAGTPLTWTATASGGAAPLQYEFWVLEPGTGWRIARAYGASNTASWTPLRPGDYAWQVWVRSAGSTASYEAWAPSGTVTITPVAPTVLSITADTLLPVALTTPVTWTAAAAGGTTPLEYRFWLYQASTGWTSVQGYGPAATWTWTPTQADTYAVQVWVRAQGSPASYDAWLGTDFFTAGSGPVQNLSLTVTQTFPSAVNAPITWTAQASGGSAPLLYQFWLLDRTTSQWTVVQSWSTTTTYTWTPTRAELGLHALQVWVKSTGSPQSYEAWLGTAYFLITP